MAPVARRAPARAAAPASGGSVNFGDDSFYLGGLGLPEGDYAMEFHTQMFQPTKQNGSPVGTPFLAVMATAYPLAGGEPTEHPLGCGQKTHESFVPSADGKGFEPVAGGSGIGMNENCNWSLFRKSLVDCGLPPGTLTNDLGVLDGIHVHTRNIPEPEERKNFRGKKPTTGEAALQQASAQAEPDRNRVCLVVTEILEQGKPWEGTGGIPANGNGATAAVAAKPAATRTAAAARPAARAAAPVAAPAAEVTDDDLSAAAINGISEVLAKEPLGCFKTKLRVGTFSAVSAVQGEDMANAVLETYFGSDDALNSLLGQLGYVVSGAKIAVSA